MKTILAVISGALAGALITLNWPAQAKPETKSVGEEICFVLVLNHIAPRCYWTP